MRIKQIYDDKVEFDDGTVVSAYHSQDCCESVWADFHSLVGQPRIDYVDFPEDLDIEVVPDFGFRMNKYFVPCYNQQNGYYSSSLSLIIEKPSGEKKEISISDGVQSFID